MWNPFKKKPPRVKDRGSFHSLDSISQYHRVCRKCWFVTQGEEGRPPVRCVVCDSKRLNKLFIKAGEK